LEGKSLAPRAQHDTTHSWSTIIAPVPHPYAPFPPAPQSKSFAHGAAYPHFPHQPSHLALLQNHPHAVPDFSAWVTIDGATAQFGKMLSLLVRVTFNVMYCLFLLFPQSFFLNSNAQLGGLIPITPLKHHFNVSNSYNYVSSCSLGDINHGLAKCAAQRLALAEFQPPRDDLNAPDLYIPSPPSPCVMSLLTRSLVSLLVMAFVTYILLGSLTVRSAIPFSPRNIWRLCDKGNCRPHT